MAAAVLALGVAGGFCANSWVSRDHGRGLGTFDLGEGRQVRIWEQPHFGDPPSLWFEASRDGRPLDRPRGLGTVRHEDHDVRVAWSADGTVCCLYDAHDPPGFFCYCDWSASRVYPGPNDGVDWQERYRRIRAANSDLPDDPSFGPLAPERVK